MDRYDASLAELGLELPEIPAPVANFVPYTVTGNLVYVSGQVPIRGKKVVFVGKLGREFSVEEGKEAARLCALSVLAAVRDACGGDLDRLRRRLEEEKRFLIDRRAAERRSAANRSLASA